MLNSFLAPILIFAGGELQFRNRAANSLIASGVISVESKTVVRFSDAATQGLFEKVKAQKAHSGTEILRVQSGSTMIVQIMRIGRVAPAAARRSREDSPVVVLVTPLSGAGLIRKRAMEGFSMFSRTEREVLAALVNGESVRAIADATQRSIATVRWHVKKMLTKTGARSISDLTRIGSLLAPY